MKSYLKLGQANGKLLLREPMTLFFTIAFPILFLMFMGTVFASAAGGGQGEAADAAARYAYGISQYVPALMGLLLGTLALNTIPVATANDRERGILRRFKATPMPSWLWIAAQISAYFVIGLISAILLIVAGRAAFGIQLPGNWGLVFAGFTLSAISFMAFGYLVASLTPNARAASICGQLLYMPMMFVSGAVMPLSILPDGIRAVSQWLPMTHIVILMQSLWFGRGWPLPSVCVLLGILVIGGTLSAWLFRWE